MGADVGVMTLARPEQGKTAYQAYQQTFEYGERLMFRVLGRPAEGLISVQVKGQVFHAEDPGNLEVGKSFVARIDATQPQLVIKRLPEDQALAFRVSQSVAPKVSYLPALVERMEQFMAQLRGLADQNTTAGRMVAELKSILSAMLDPQKITPEGMKSLFTALGAGRQSGLWSLAGRFASASLPQTIDALLKLPAPAWRAAVDAGWSMENLESVLRGLSSMQKSVEILRAANIALSDKGNTIYLEWPPYHAESGPLKILIRRDSGGRGARRKSGKGELRVDMELTLTSLGQVRVNMNYGKSLNLVIQSESESRKHLEGYRDKLIQGLSALKKPVRVEFTTFPAMDEKLPGLAALLGGSQGGDGRLHVKA